MFGATFRAESGLDRLIAAWRDVATHELPPAARSLLVHRTSMTLRLDLAARDRMEIRLLHERETASSVDEVNGMRIERAVLLERGNGRGALELGFLAVRLDRLTGELCDRLREGREPFGRLLAEAVAGAERRTSLNVAPERFGLIDAAVVLDLIERLGVPQESIRGAFDRPGGLPAMLPARIALLSIEPLSETDAPPAMVDNATSDTSPPRVRGAGPLATAVEILLPAALTLSQ
jgi:chorismate-pyruvate lyase